MHLGNRLRAIREGPRGANRHRNGIGKRRRQLAEQPVHERALHARRHRSGLLVDRHDATGMHRRVVIVGLAANDFVFGIGELQAAAAPELERPEEHDALPCVKDVAQKRLIREDGPHASGRVLHDQLEEPEAGPARRTHTARHDVGDDGRGRPGRSCATGRSSARFS